MSSVNGGQAPPPQLRPDCLSLFAEGISLVLSRWTALRMAVENEWGGRDSRGKFEQLASDIFHWFSQSKDPLYIDDLENILDESMVLSFNTEIEDGSVEEVAEELMIMHEDFLQGNYQSIEKLRNSSSGAEAVSQSRRVVNDEDEESSDDEEANMAVDEPKPRLNLESIEKSSDLQKPIEAVDADGWSVVPARRNRGKKH